MIETRYVVGSVPLFPAQAQPREDAKERAMSVVGSLALRERMWGLKRKSGRLGVRQGSTSTEVSSLDGTCIAAV